MSAAEIHTDQIREIVDQVARLVREHYVFPDVGNEVAGAMALTTS